MADLMHPEWARRFYGMAVPYDVVRAASDERLTDRSITDLVDAHLGINFGYFGAIDKTLAGFVVLDSTGDDYTLLDARDGGQVWWQDHETRTVELRHDSLAAWLARSDGPAETPKLAQRGTRAITTPALCARYQWLVWMLARPLERDGRPIQEIEYLVRSGIGRLRHVWPRRDALEAAFEVELGLVRNDPHLAIYWLLHVTVFADHARRQRLVDTLGDAGPELVRAFVTRFGALPIAGDVPVVPGFRMRRALAQTYGETELLPDAIPHVCLLALELDPATSSLVHALQVSTGLERGVLAVEDVAEVMARIPAATPGVELVRALLAKRGGAKASPHADVLARLLPAAPDPWWYALEALWQVHELAYDGAALVAATRSLVARDRYHRRTLQMAMRSAQIANEPEAVVDAIERDLAFADQVINPFQKLVEQPREWQATVAAVATKAQRALAWRVLQRAGLNKPSPELAAWASEQVVAEPAGVALVGDAFAAMDAETQSGVVGAIARVIDRADHPLVAILLACVDGPEPAPNDFAAQFTMKRAKGAALIALAPWFHTPVLFGRLIALVERPASGSVVDLFWAKLFSPSEKASYVVPALDATQAVRCAKALIATELRHPSIHARNAAGHQLYRFSHPGAETFLIDALTDYGVRYAAAKGPGGAVLDHGKTEHDQLEDLVANLYAAVRGLKTPASREALIERLFAERRSYWRLGSAIGEVWSPELHARVMQLLAERRDARAAGAYAYALHEFVKKGAPLVDLARLVREWQGDTEVARGFLHYALVVAIWAALEARDYALVRLAHENAAWIAEPPLSPDAFARGRGWSNPLDTEDAKRALAAALSGEAAAERTALQEAARKARAAGTPDLKIKDAALGQLANAQVAARLLHDAKTGEIWFRDREGLVHYFDGYDVVPAPFTARSIGDKSGERDGAAAELTGELALAERALWWGPHAEEFRDAVRFGRRVLMSWGINNGSFERYVLSFADAAHAARAFTQLRANPAPGFTEFEPYYLPGKGAIVRTYYVREGTGDPQRQTLAIVDGVLEGAGDLGGEAAAIAEHTRRELAWLAGGGMMTCLEWADNRRRRTDLTVREWVNKRVRGESGEGPARSSAEGGAQVDAGKSAAWHVEALAEIGHYLADHQFRVPLEVQLVSPTTPADIAAFAAARTVALPTALDTLWRTIGAASWRLGERGARLLAPLEVLARRPVARAAAEVYLAKLAPAAAAQAAPLLRSLDVVVESLDGQPLTFVADVTRDDERVFAHATEHFHDFWWESSLGWMLATGLLSDLEDAIATAEPSVERLRYGEVAKPPAKAKPKAKAKAKKPAKAKTAAKAKPKPAKPQPKAKAKPTQKAAAKQKSPAKPKPKPKTKPKTKPKPKPKTKPKTKRSS